MSTYRALKRQFNLDDALLDDLKEELIYGQQLAVDEDGRVLVWTGGMGKASGSSPLLASSPTTEPQHAPLPYTLLLSPKKSSPPALASKASASR